MVKKLLIVLGLCLICTGGIGTQDETRASYVSVIPLWVEPVEVCYIIPADGKCVIRVSSGMADRVYFIPSPKAMLAEYGYEIKDIQIWIHNHLSTTDFSKNDIILYWYLKYHGFEGLYMLKNDRGVFYYNPEVEEK